MTEREKCLEAIFQAIGEWSASGVLTPSTVLVKDITDAVNSVLASRDAEIAELQCKASWADHKVRDLEPRVRNQRHEIESLRKDKAELQVEITQLREAPINEKWNPSQKFKGKLIPRWDNRKEGPFMQSMSLCVCGSRWNNHRFSDGACPKIKKT